jgi:hypothetical protein
MIRRKNLLAVTSQTSLGSSARMETLRTTGGPLAVPRSCARTPTPRSNCGEDGSAAPQVSSWVVLSATSPLAEG